MNSSKSFEMPLLSSAFSNVLPQVICGQPIGREIAIAKDRSKWRQLTHSIPKPPDA